VAVRLARLNKRLSDADHTRIVQTAKGKSLKALAADLVESLDPDRHLEIAGSNPPQTNPRTDQQIEEAKVQLIRAAVEPIYNPELREILVELQKKTEQTIDHISQDQVISAGFDADALEKAKGMVDSFKDFIEANKDEITALQILYNRPYKTPLGAEQLPGIALSQSSQLQGPSGRGAAPVLGRCHP
jgi:type I restriction enzyme R subunit